MLLELDRVTSGYGRSEIVHQASLTMEPGEIFALLGPNGAGKTTLLRTIAGLLPLRSGRMRWEDADITKRDPVSSVGRGIVLVPEGRQIFVSMTVRENLLMGAFLRRRDPTVNEDLDRMVEHFPVLGQKLKSLGSAMSGGEQQMLAIARGLMARPKLLLLDEPSLGLAPILVNRLRPIIEGLAADFGAAVLLVEQSMSLALGVAGRAALLHSGRLSEPVTAAEMLEAAARENLYMRPGAAVDV
jgi:branched-chain amino acid transport system ATP-binding protein